MIESQYTAKVHSKLPDLIHSWKINDNYAGGAADAFYRRKDKQHGKILWVEYKFLQTLPKRDTTVIAPKLTAQQREWLDMAVGAGEQAIVIIGVANEKRDRGASGAILQPDEWDGIMTGDLRNRLKSYNEIANSITNLVVP